MIVTNNESHIENNMGSETQQFGIEISPLLYKLMYSSMYEDKEQVVLQELSANALDAHKVAGKEHIPINITLPTQLSPELVVQDFGVGMSYETVSSIYPSYGKSTKSHNNELTGGFGYGSKSPFALTDAFTVVTTHKGITTKVACFLDGGVPNFTVFNSVETGEEDGTTVRVPISSEQVQKTLEEKVNYLFWLWPVPPNVSTKEDTYFVDFNKEYKIYSTPLYEVYKDKVSKYLHGYISWRTTAEPRVGVGAFTYKIPTNMRNKLIDCEAYAVFRKQTHGMENFLVIPKFQIGELELSPSREVIEDTPENMAVIEERYQEIFKQVKAICKKPVFTIYKELIDLLCSRGVWLADIVKTAPYNYLVAIDKQVLTDYLAGVLDNSDNPLTKAYFAETVWNDLSLLTEGSDQYSTEEIIDLFRKTLRLGVCFTRYVNGVSHVFASIKDDLLEAGVADRYVGRIKVLDFYALINQTEDQAASVIFQAAPGERPNESFIHPKGSIGHRSAYFVRGFVGQTHILFKEDLSSRIVNHTIRTLYEDSNADKVISIDSFNEEYYKPAIDWCIKNLNWKITYHSREEIEQNWASKPKTTRTGNQTKSGLKSKVNEVVVAKLWKDGSFQEIMRKDFEETLVSAEDYIWVVKGSYCPSLHTALRSLINALPATIQTKVKLFQIDTRQCNTVKISQILDTWSKYDVFTITPTSSLIYPSQYADVKDTWPLYKAYASTLRAQATLVSIFDHNDCSKRAYDVVKELVPSLVTFDHALLAPRQEYSIKRHFKTKLQAALPASLLGKLLALRYCVEHDSDVVPALELFTKKDKKALTKFLRDEVITPITKH